MDALSRQLIKIIYYILKDKVPYQRTPLSELVLIDRGRLISAPTQASFPLPTLRGYWKRKSRLRSG
jgi:hypothetical protein